MLGSVLDILQHALHISAQDVRYAKADVTCPHYNATQQQRVFALLCYKLCNTGAPKCFDKLIHYCS